MSIRTRFESLRFGTKVYVLLTVLVAGVMAVSGTMFVVSQNRALLEAHMKQGQSLAETIAKNSQVGLLLEDKDFIAEASSGVLTLPDVLFVDFFRADRSLVLSIGEGQATARGHDPDFEMAERSGLATFDGGRGALGDPVYRAFLIPVDFREEAGGVGYIQVGVSREAIGRQLERTLRTTVFVTVLLILIACALAYSFVKKITRPITQLADGALRIADGDLKVHLDLETKDELGELARNFNFMARSLDQKTEQLRASEEKYRSLFEHIAQALYICDMNGKLLDCNQAMVDLFGYGSRTEMVRAIQMAEDLYADPDRRPKLVERVMRQGGAKTYENEFKRKDGSIIKALVTPRVRVNEQGESIGFEGMIQDVTELRSLEEQLLQSQKMQAVGTLAGGIAHDFNNLLTVVISNTEELEDRFPEGTRERSLAALILKAAGRAAELTQNLVGFARKGKVRAEVFSPTEVIGEVLNLLRETIDRRISLEMAVTPGIWFVQGDPGQLHQVIVNLCVNARDAIAPMKPGHIQIGIRNEEVAATPPGTQIRRGKYVKLSVQDDGSGIPPEDLAHIFEPFFTTKAKGEGSGLGLATVYGIVSNHDGHIFVESEAGRGTRFDIYLPAVEPPSESDTPFLEDDRSGKAGGAVESRRGASTILVVDDEEAILESMKDLLERRGYRVIATNSGREALRLVEQAADHPSLAIVDLVMPELSGHVLIDELKLRSPDLPVIVTTGYFESQLQQGSTGPPKYNGFLRKPYRRREVYAEIDRVLAHRSADGSASGGYPGRREDSPRDV